MVKVEADRFEVYILYTITYVCNLIYL